MKKVRFIGMKEQDGSLNKETIVFTEDFSSPASDWLARGMEVYTDKIIDMQVPMCFPMDKEFSA